MFNFNKYISVRFRVCFVTCSFFPDVSYMKRSLSNSVETWAKSKKLDYEARKTLKIVSWNCDGIKPYISAPEAGSLDRFVGKKGVDGDGGKLTRKDSFLGAFLSRHSPDVLCLQEVKVKSSERASVLARIKRDCKDTYDAFFCLPLSEFGPAKFGVLTLVKRGLEVSKARTVDWDFEGRIHILEFEDLVLLNVYALNGSNYPYKDPKTGKMEGTRNERKRAFQVLLAQECQNMSKPVVLLGDLNISRYPIDCFPRLRIEHPHDIARAHFNELFADYIDAIRHVHGEEAKKFSWFQRSVPQGTDAARVDLILLSEGLRQRLQNADILDDPGERGNSDHAPMFLYLSPPNHQRE